MHSAVLINFMYLQPQTNSLGFIKTTIYNTFFHSITNIVHFALKQIQNHEHNYPLKVQRHEPQYPVGNPI